MLCPRYLYMAFRIKYADFLLYYQLDEIVFLISYILAKEKNTKIVVFPVKICKTPILVNGQIWILKGNSMQKIKLLYIYRISIGPLCSRT